MPHAEVYARTAKGTLEARNRASALPAELQPVLKSIDGHVTLAELTARLRLPGGDVQQALQRLERGGYIQPAAANSAEAEKARASQQASGARSEASKAAAQERLQAALIAGAQAAARAREVESAESAARAAAASTEGIAARARVEAQALARAESEAQARAHAEAHARAMVEAQLKAMGTALARAQALAREEADARARLTADMQAREAAEARARADAAARARAEAERDMRAELARLQREAQEALEAADTRAAAERQAREAAEALAQEERTARAAAEADVAARLEAQRRAHAAARAATETRMAEEKAAREAAETRAQAEVDARRARESALEASAEEQVRLRVAEEMRTREEAERAADAAYRAEAERRARRAAAAQTPEPAKLALRQRPLESMLFAKVAGVSALVALAAAALVMPLIPLDGYVPAAERAAAAYLREPVRIGRMEYRLLPSPRLTLDRVAIGASYASRIDHVTVYAWPWELLHAPLRLDHVAVNGAVIAADQARMLAALLQQRGNASRVQSIDIGASRVTLQDLELPLSSAAIRFGHDGAVRSLHIASGDAVLDAVPLGAAAWQVRLEARNWRLPLASAVRFDALSVNGLVADGRLRDARVEGRLAGGELTGLMSADWRDSIRAEGRFQLTKAELRVLLAACTAHFTAQGTLDGEGAYAVQAASLARLLEAPRMTASFRVNSGELAKVDIVQALQQVTAKGVQGGRTRFDQLAGTLEVAGDRYRYRQLRLSSGPMSASGDVEIAPGNRLAGRVMADLRSGAGTAIRASLTVGGTLANPVLQP